MNEPVDLDLQRPREGEMRDLSASSFRFIAIFILAVGVLMLAGVL
jgi:hypothetical protein